MIDLQGRVLDLLGGIERADVLEELAATRAARVSDDNAVEGPFFRALAGKSDRNGHDGEP